MAGGVEGEVTEIKPFDLHGVTYYDVALVLPDGTTHSARLGPEGVPDGLAPGDRVLITMVANMVVALRRPSDPA